MAQNGSPLPLPDVIQKFFVKGLNVVITGGGRGLGFSFAVGLAQAGANIAAIDITETVGEHFYQLSQYGGKYQYYQTDVTDYQGLKATIDLIAEDFGSIDGWYV